MRAYHYFRRVVRWKAGKRRPRAEQGNGSSWYRLFTRTNRNTPQTRPFRRDFPLCCYFTPISSYSQKYQALATNDTSMNWLFTINFSEEENSQSNREIGERQIIRWQPLVRTTKAQNELGRKWHTFGFGSVTARSIHEYPHWTGNYPVHRKAMPLQPSISQSTKPTEKIIIKKYSWNR